MGMNLRNRLRLPLTCGALLFGFSAGAKAEPPKAAPKSSPVPLPPRLIRR